MSEQKISDATVVKSSIARQKRNLPRSRKRPVRWKGERPMEASVAATTQQPYKTQSSSSLSTLGFVNTRASKKHEHISITRPTRQYRFQVSSIDIRIKDKREAERKTQRLRMYIADLEYRGKRTQRESKGQAYDHVRGL